MGMKRYLQAVVLMFFAVPLFASQPITLKKALFHEGASNNKGPFNIELGNMLFYFDKDPRVESSVVARNSTTLHVLFFANVQLSQDARESLNSIVSRAKQHACTMRFSQKNSDQQKGLEIVMQYPTNSVGMKYDHFKTMKLQNGIRLQLYNKQLIHRIKQIGKEVITTASLNPPRVFVDCGHGGVDCGAMSNSLQEKDVTLAIGLDVAKQLRSQGVRVALSRSKDMSVPLDIRTSLANKYHSDLFVSIHANATTNTTAHGIETYYFDPSHLSTIPGDNSPIHSLLSAHHEACHDDKCKKSSDLASCVHDKVLKSVRSEYLVKDRQIKFAPFQVLLGTHMPSILVEVGFITHPQEARLLSQKSYQHMIASGIATGIMHYLKRS